MRIAFLKYMLTSPTGAGGNVHVSQVVEQLFKNGHTLYSNLQNESEKFVCLNKDDFYKRGDEIDLFYVRIHGHEGHDSLTLLRETNWKAPCVWEVNAPLEELRTKGVSEERLAQLNIQRKKIAQDLVDGAICVSAEMETYAREELGIVRTVVIPNGSDPNLFSPLKRQEGIFDKTKFTVFWAGSPEYSWQGIKTVIKVANRLEELDSNIQLAVTADGKSTDTIKFLGKIAYPDMPVYLASADAGLCIYEDIDFFKKFFFSPLKLYDYMASGLPVIGSDLGQIKEILYKCQNGVLTSTKVNDIVEKIIFLRDNSEKAKNMGRNGRKAVEQTYNWGNVVKRSELFFESLIESRQTNAHHGKRGSLQRFFTKFGSFINR